MPFGSQKQKRTLRKSQNPKMTCRKDNLPPLLPKTNRSLPNLGKISKKGMESPLLSLRTVEHCEPLCNNEGFSTQ